MHRTRRWTLLLLLAACTGPAAEPPPPAARADTGAAAPAPPAPGDTAAAAAADGRLVYVPVYSHIYFRDTRRTINLAATLSIRNTDPARPITLLSVRYFDDAGRPVRGYLARPLRLAPLASTAYVVEEDDTRGGTGASFLVGWTAGGLVSEPLVEAVMISVSAAQGISFTSRGVPVARR